MARYDVFANPIAAERKHTPFLLEVQNSYIDGLHTRVMIPLRRKALFGAPARGLNPSVEVKKETLILDTAALGAVPVSELRESVASLATQRAVIQQALDTLLGGY